MKKPYLILFLIAFVACVNDYENEILPTKQQESSDNESHSELAEASAKVRFDFIFCNQWMGGEGSDERILLAPFTDIRVNVGGKTYHSKINQDGFPVIDNLPVNNGFNLISPLRYDVFFKGRYFFSDSILHAGIYNHGSVRSAMAIIDISDTEILSHHYETAEDSLGNAVIRFHIQARGKASDENWRQRGAFVFISNTENPVENSSELSGHYLTTPGSKLHRFDYNGVVEFKVRDLFNTYSSNRNIYYSIYGISGFNNKVSGYKEALENGENLPGAYPTLSESFQTGTLQF